MILNFILLSYHSRKVTSLSKENPHQHDGEHQLKGNTNPLVKCFTIRFKSALCCTNAFKLVSLFVLLWDHL